ncbi:MAG: DUF1326 domain-containing protein, partial [Elusimicrobia bacterium]|nr:DUF1326 domain-containing protein [Elusimicrobiota bacterium]
MDSVHHRPDDARHRGEEKAETAPANNAGTANSAAPATQPWHMSGDLEEACKCNGACPCWFGNMPTRMNCGGHVAAFIDKGAYGNTPLDGLAFVRTGQSQDGKTMLENMGNWTFDYLYIDEKATPDQRKALEQIAWATMPKMSKDTQVKYVPITRTVDGKEHKVQVGSVGGFSAHLVEGGMGGTTKIVNPPGADPMHAEYEQGETSSFTF